MELSVAKSSIENHGFLSLQFSSPISNPNLSLPGPVDRCNASRGRGAIIGAGGIADDEEVVMRVLELSADECHQTNRIFIPKPADDGSSSHDGREIAGNLPRIVEPTGGRVAHDKAQGDGLYVWIGQPGIVRIYDTMADKRLDLSELQAGIVRKVPRTIPPRERRADCQYTFDVAIVSVFELKPKYLISFCNFPAISSIFEPFGIASFLHPSLFRILSESPAMQERNAEYVSSVCLLASRGISVLLDASAASILNRPGEGGVSHLRPAVELHGTLAK